MKTSILCDLYGGQWFLNLLHPYWVCMLFFVFGYLLLLFGRLLFEGRAYNVARSADIGDIALTLFITIAARIIQRPNFHPSLWMESIPFHLVVVLGSVLVIVYFLKPKLARHTMDKFHAIVLAPVIFYFVITSAPVLWCYGSETEKFIGILSILTWVVLVVYDTKANRMDQRKWIAIHKPNWKFKN